MKTNNHDFQYGRIYSDYTNKTRSEDLTENKKIKLSCIFNKLGLPLPKANQYSDCMSADFNAVLDSHGLFIRVGYISIQKHRLSFFEDRNHPTFNQPLVYVTDIEARFYVAIYPGVLLYDHYTDFIDSEEGVKFKHLLMDAGLFSYDFRNKNNVGYLITNNQPTPIVIDIDGFSDHFSLVSGTPLDNDLIKRTEQTRQIHQPLRELFAKAWPGAKTNTGTPNPKKMKQAFDACKQWVQKGQNVHKHQRSSYINENSVTVWKNENITFTQKLYTPWTKNMVEKQAKKKQRLEKLRQKFRR